MDHSETAPPRGPSHKLPPNTNTIAYASKILLIGPWYLLWGYASVCQIQKWMITVIYWMEHKAPNEGARESTQEAEGVCNPIGGTTIWTNQYPQSSLGLNHQSKKTHGGTRVSSCVCSRGWPSRSLMGGEALGLVKVLCSSIGECQGQEAGVGGLGSWAGGWGGGYRGLSG